MKNTILTATLVASLNASAVLGPIPIYLNTEYRTDSPVIGSIASTISFDEFDIRASGANDFMDFLATVPSINLFNTTGNVPAVFIRGNEARHTLVMIDGVSINDISSVDGAVGYGLKNISLNDIEKVEVIKGSGSVLYGSSAIAGVIAITTKKGSNGKKFATDITYGSNNSKKYSILAASGDKNSYIRLSHNNSSVDGISARSNNIEKDNISNSNSNFKFGVKSDKNTIDISYLTSENTTEYDDSFGTNHDKYFKRSLTKSNINISTEFNKNWTTKLAFSQTKSNRDEYSSGVFQTWSGDNFKSTDLTILNTIKLNNSLLNIGLTKLDDENISKNQKFNSKDIFVNFQKNINNFDVNTGFRFIKHNEFGNEIVYNLATSKFIASGIQMFGSYNTGFKAPTIYQASDIDNPQKLKAETSNNVELGIKKIHNWGNVEFRVFSNEVKDIIDMDSGFVYFFNDDKLKTKGLELSVSANIKDYFMDFGYSLVDSKKNDETTQSLRRPKNTINLAISKQYGGFNSKVQIINKSSSLDTGNIKLNGYTLLNLSTSYEFNDNAKLLFNINNALDKDYTIANGYNQLGRTFNLGLNYEF